LKLLFSTSDQGRACLQLKLFPDKEPLGAGPSQYSILIKLYENNVSQHSYITRPGDKEWEKAMDELPYIVMRTPSYKKREDGSTGPREVDESWVTENLKTFTLF